jgi:hypothetical protein
MAIIFLYPPPGGSGLLAVVFFDGFNHYIGLYDTNTGKTDNKYSY